MSTRKFAALAYSNISSTQLSTVQSQLDAKAPLAGATFTGTVAIQGNLSVTGATTTLNTEQVTIRDPVVVLNANALDQPTGIYMHTPTTNVAIVYQNDALELISTHTANTSTTYVTDSYVSLRANVVHANAIQTPLANSRVLVSNATGHIVESSVSASNVAYVQNVTSDIQSQLDVLANKTDETYVFVANTWTHTDGLVVKQTPLQFTPSPYSTYAFTTRTFLTTNAATNQSFTYGWSLPANTAQFVWGIEGLADMLTQSNVNMLSVDTSVARTHQMAGILRTANCSGNLALTANSASTSYSFSLLPPSYLAYQKLSSVNFAPTAISGINGTYTLTYATPLVLSLQSLDSENDALVWSYSALSTVGATAAIAQSANVFTITPSTSELDHGTFTLRFAVSDGTYAVTKDVVFTLPSTPPTIAPISSTYTLSTISALTIITLGATDAETASLTYSYQGNPGSIASILRNGIAATANVFATDNVFTIAPSVGETYAGSFQLRFAVSDGVNTTYTNYGTFTKPSTAPTVSNINSTYTLSTTSVDTVITVSATDAEGTPLSYAYQVVSGSPGLIATVKRNGIAASPDVFASDNVFTISPSAGETYAGSFTLRFAASDGTNTTYTNNAVFTKPSTAPTITSSLNASYTLATNGTDTVITITATDAEGTPLTYAYQVVSGTLSPTASVLRNGVAASADTFASDNVFTIRPSTNTANGGTFSLRFSVTDGTNTVYTNGASFSLVFDSTPPTITSTLNSSYALATDGTATTITITATDPATPITYGYELTSGTVGSTATITQTSNVFTITPSTNTANGGSFALRFWAQDSYNNRAYTSSATFSLLFPGGTLYSTPGTYSWTAPAGVTSVCVVCVGGGGGGLDLDLSGYAKFTYFVGGGGGGGGGLGWKNAIAVTPGSSYTVVVGAGGSPSDSSGGTSYFINTSTVAGYGGNRGGMIDTNTSAGGGGGGYTGAGGGSGGMGGYASGTWEAGAGGGAGGYSGNGGFGYQASYFQSNDSSGGGSGGGASGGCGGDTNGPTSQTDSYSGGGVGLYGQGASGNAVSGKGGGQGGSGGANGGLNVAGGAYGGGGCGGSWSGRTAYAGGRGAVRIIWGAGRSFPTTNVSLASSTAGETTV